jgi:hypothetical protein
MSQPPEPARYEPPNPTPPGSGDPTPAPDGPTVADAPTPALPVTDRLPADDGPTPFPAPASAFPEPAASPAPTPYPAPTPDPAASGPTPPPAAPGPTPYAPTPYAPGPTPYTPGPTPHPAGPAQPGNEPTLAPGGEPTVARGSAAAPPPPGTELAYPHDPYAGAYPGGDPYAPEYTVPPYGTAGYGPPAYTATPTNGLAVAALVVSVTSPIIGGLTAPVGAILGHVARRRIRESGEQGDGLALAAIIVGWIMTGLLVCSCGGLALLAFVPFMAGV